MADTDGDGSDDGAEVTFGTSPTEETGALRAFLVRLLNSLFDSLSELSSRLF